jgi:hypothetical protein
VWYEDDTPPRAPVDGLTDPEIIATPGWGPSRVGKVRIPKISFGPKLKVTSSSTQDLVGVSDGDMEAQAPKKMMVTRDVKEHRGWDFIKYISISLDGSHGTLKIVVQVLAA